ncbi:MAG: DUF115 domain-containing protein [gamma proteobacterium symbiont of Taylorina sp.]|nr:DUF115 domain-containing protein [gamma proteobacterium symbiont of Taylorina sp.]
MINKVKTVKSFAAQYYYLNEYLFLRQAIEDIINHLTWQFQSQLHGKTFVQKQLENIAENHTPGILLKDYFKGKSALILAGGPSLDNYIEWIEENQNHYMVIAVSRIARRLLQTKIKPDIFVSVDPYPVNFNISKPIFNYINDSLLIHQYHINPILLGNWLGVNLYLGDIFPWETKLNKENFTGIGPTVTNTAIKLAIDMGIKQQILFGVDLCYSPDGYTHAKGSNEHDAGPDINSIAQTVITNKGEKAETNSAYYEAVTVIEHLAELAITTNNGKLINPSPNSTKMKNVEHILIENIEIGHKSVTITSFLQKQLSIHEDSYFKVKHYQTVLKELNTTQFKVNKIEELANKGLEYNEKFFANNNPEANFNFKLKMDKLEKELNHIDLIKFSDLSKKFGMNEFLYFLNPDSDREWTNEDIKKSGDIYYRALRTGATELNKHIFTAINRIEVRLLEHDKLAVNDELINRHLNSFNKSYTLDRIIASLKTSIIKNSNKKNIEQQQKEEQELLEKHIKIKQETIKSCSDLFVAYKNGDKSLGNAASKRKLAIIFDIVMRQIDRDAHSAKIYVIEKNKPEFYTYFHQVYISKVTFTDEKMYDVTSEEYIKQVKNHFNLFLKTTQPVVNKIDTLKFEGLEIKLYNKFVLKDEKSLRKIIKSLNFFNTKETECKSFLHLAKGYQYELSNEFDLAVQEYGYANSDRTIESALKRIAFISLEKQDFVSANDALIMLSEISPAYLAQLAEIYFITKNYNDALELYAQYLDYNPADIIILTKVAKLYESQNISDGAKFIYNQILELEPDNQIANTYLKQCPH